MADTTDRPDDSAPGTETPVTDRATDRAERNVRAFVAAHGGTAEGQLSYLGQRGYRLVLVGGDGAWGDQVAPRRETLATAAERAGVTLRDSLDGELAGRMRGGPTAWARMADRVTGG